MYFKHWTCRNCGHGNTETEQFQDLAGARVECEKCGATFTVRLRGD